MSKWYRKAGIGMTLGLAAMGCAKERDPINRVQAYALAKNFFVGPNLQSTSDDPEFYYRGTLTDVGYGASQDGLFTSTYAQPVSRIKWEITEDRLTARLAYERIAGSDGKQGTANGGQVVAAFAIVKHFDIRRAYNTSTGEELNVVEENDTDRPWYERGYFRVDWRKNLVKDTYDFDLLSQLGVFGGVHYEDMDYYVDDPNQPDAPAFSESDGYFDITQKVFATPQTIDIPPEYGGGKLPTCLFNADLSGGTAPIANCNPIELKLRLSFRRVIDTDYEPENYDGLRFQAFGAFTPNQPTYGYARNYGVTDDKALRPIERYNIWKKSHYYDKQSNPIACGTQDTTPVGADPNRDDDQNGTADECEGVTAAVSTPGARCDVISHKCTLPYQSRETKKVVWYLHENGSQDLFDPTDWAAQEWDVALRSAVQVARLVECRKGKMQACEQTFPVWTGQEDDNEDAALVARAVNACRRKSRETQMDPTHAKASCDAIADQTSLSLKNNDPALALPIAALVKQPNLIVLCHNPVISGDDEACGTVGFQVRVGDLRYHAVNIVNAPQAPSPWGIMVDGKDPLTGEVIASSVNIWNSVTDMASQNAVDIIRYVNGEIKTEDITNGKYVRDWVQANEGAPGGTVLPPLSKDEVTKRLASVSGVDPAIVKEAFEHRLHAAPPTPKDKIAASIAQNIGTSIRAQSDPSQSTNASRILTRMQQAQGTDFEAQLINKPMLEATGTSQMPSDATQELVRNLASPLRRGDPSVQHVIQLAKQNAAAQRGMCIVEDAPEFSGIVSLAKVMKEKFPLAQRESANQGQTRAERMRKYLARHYQYGVIAHEMGHSMGLRHNFVSSYDAFNYRPQYWQTRTRNGTVTQKCMDAKTPAQAQNCVGPRYFDPVTQEETDNLVWMWAQSSVMDYPGDTSVDMLGLGAYDYAAVRMFYGDSVSVYNQNAIKDKQQRLDIINRTDNFGGILGLQTGLDHYSQIQNNYHVLQSCQPYASENNKPSTWDEQKDGVFHPVLDGHVVRLNGFGETKCRQLPVDYSRWTDLREPTSEELGQAFSTSADTWNRGGVIDPQNRVRAPYGFASDNWADVGNLSVFRFDQGADPYEQIMFYITASENRHIFDHYRRNRASFAIRPVINRDFDRYTSKMMNASKGLGLIENMIRSDSTKFPAGQLVASPMQGLPFHDLWSYEVGQFLSDNALAASLAMDHFARQLTRPQAGEHIQPDGPPNLSPQGASMGGDTRLTPKDPVLRSKEGYYQLFQAQQKTSIVIPNGTTGYFQSVGIGGQPINNALDHSKGDYAVEYPLNVGSYYQKIYSVLAMTESRDNFISESRGDFVDARYRAVSMADVFPDGFRRLMANALTDDHVITGPRVAASNNMPRVDTSGYPVQPIGWTSWWPVQGPETCWSNGSYACRKLDYVSQGSQRGQLVLHPGEQGFTNQAPSAALAVDPQIGWEVQKYIIAWAFLFLPENQRVDWFNQMRIYKSSQSADATTFQDAAYLVWKDPFTGVKYAARKYGAESIFGKEVQKGIAARVLEYCNDLTQQAFVLDTTNQTGRDSNSDGIDDATGELLLHVDPTTNQPVVAPDPFYTTATGGTPGADACDTNRACQSLKAYQSIPEFLNQAGIAYHLTEGTSPRGIY